LINLVVFPLRDLRFASSLRLQRAKCQTTDWNKATVFQV